MSIAFLQLLDAPPARGMTVKYAGHDGELRRHDSEREGNDRFAAPAAAPRCARHPGLRAGQEQRARLSESVQAVVERDAARAEPARARSLSRRREPVAGLSRGLGKSLARGDRWRFRP